jgi:hypothetical protein
MGSTNIPSTSPPSQRYTFDCESSVLGTNPESVSMVLVSPSKVCPKIESTIFWRIWNADVGSLFIITTVR